MMMMMIRLPQALALTGLLCLWSAVIVSVSGQSHPLDSITADEITAVVDILREDNRLTNTTRFGYISLQEPDKDMVKSFTVGDPVVRRALAYIQDGTDGYKAVVDITATSVVSFEPAARRHGPP